MNRFVIGLLLICALALLCADTDALYKQGAAVFQSDPAKALGLFEQAGEAGNVSAMVGAGHRYESGTGTPVDYAKAVNCAKAYMEGQEDAFGAYCTLACAYARNGQFKQAEAAMMKTISLMRKTKFYDQYINEYKQLLKAFQNGQAWPPDNP